MSDQFNPSTESGAGAGFQMDAFIPLVILSLGFIVLLVWQVINASNQRSLLESAITRQQPAVAQAQHLQDSVSKLASDLLAAAQNDDLAKEIVAKYKIQQQGAPATPDASAPAASATP